MSELLQADKDRIVLEEQFRALTKADLESQKPKKPMTTWDYLNSSFVLLLLSSVVISGIGRLFTTWQADREKIRVKEAAQREQDKRDARINAEIGYRVSILLVSLSVASENPDAKVADGKLGKGHTESEIKQALNLFVNGRSPGVTTLYPEFGNSSVLQLATELRNSDQNRKNDALGQVIADMSAIDLMPMTTFANPLKVASTIQQQLNRYPAWRESNFYFTDCGPEVPFC